MRSAVMGRSLLPSRQYSLSTCRCSVFLRACALSPPSFSGSDCHPVQCGAHIPNVITCCVVVGGCGAVMGAKPLLVLIFQMCLDIILWLFLNSKEESLK